MIQTYPNPVPRLLMNKSALSTATPPVPRLLQMPPLAQPPSATPLPPQYITPIGSQGDPFMMPPTPGPQLSDSQLPPALMPPIAQPPSIQPWSYAALMRSAGRPLNTINPGTGSPFTVGTAQGDQSGFTEPPLPTGGGPPDPIPGGPHNELGLDPGGANYPGGDPIEPGMLPGAGGPNPPAGSNFNPNWPGNGSFDPYGPDPNPSGIGPQPWDNNNPSNLNNNPRGGGRGAGRGGLPAVTAGGRGGGTGGQPTGVPGSPGYQAPGQHFDYSSGHVVNDHASGGFLRNFAPEQQFRDPMKFGRNMTAEAGRTINTFSPFQQQIRNGGLRITPEIRAALNAWSAAHTSIFQPGMQRGGG